MIMNGGRVSASMVAVSYGWWLEGVFSGQVKGWYKKTAEGSSWLQVSSSCRRLIGMGGWASEL